MGTNSNEKIRTEDVIELLDGKILTTRAHSSLAVVMRENYDTVLGNIATQVLSPAQKEAFDNTLTSPSASNPVVLKDDLQTYVPAADLGNIKDSVPTFGDLPLVGNDVGDLRGVIADGVIYRWDGSAWNEFIRTGTLDHTDLTNHNGDTNYQHLTLAEYTSLTSNTHTHSNKLILDQIVSAGSGQIITAAERLRLPSASEKAALAGTSGVPSNTNRYVTNQDPRLNTTRNPYVTVGPPGSLASFTGVDFKPFEDAMVAIDIGSAQAVKAIETLPGTFSIGAVILKWDTQTSALLMEAFVPGTVTLSFQQFQAGIQALLPGTGALTVRGFVFELNAAGTSGILSERPNTLIEDCIFKPGPSVSINQIGVILKGDNSIVRRCSFLNQLETGIEIHADNCRVEECVFNLTDPNNRAVDIKATASNSVVDHNYILSGRIDVRTGADYSQITNNFWNKNSTTVSPVLITGNPLVVSTANTFESDDTVYFETVGSLPPEIIPGKRYYVRSPNLIQFNISETAGGTLLQTATPAVGVFTVTRAFLVKDSAGSTTRFLGNLPQEINQPYVSKLKTIGPSGSLADYRGDTDEVFSAALSDVFAADTTNFEFEILPGNYTFARTLEIPDGVKIRGVTQNSSVDMVSIVSSVDLPVFNLASNTTLENLTLASSNNKIVTASNATNVKIERCKFDLIAVLAASDYGLLLTGSIDCFVRHCEFVGQRGLHLDGSQRAHIISNKFDTALVPFLQDNSCEEDHIKDNFFIQTVSPEFEGDRHIIEGNHFLGNLPTKLNTSDSVWQSNYPSPEANNLEGIDFVDIYMDAYIDPYFGAASRSEFYGIGTISFPDSVDTGAITLPIKIPARVNTLTGFTVQMFWTSALSSGDVMWEMTVTFRDETSGLVGAASVPQQFLDTRVGATPQDEDSVIWSFPTYGIVNPTHVTVEIKRVGTHPSDNMLTDAHVTDVKITIPRD